MLISPYFRVKRRYQSASCSVEYPKGTHSAGGATRRDARRNHERLLVEAKALFAEQGIEASLDERATRAGVGAGTVYRHFPSRDDLVRELYDRAIAPLDDLAEEILAAPSGWQGVELYVERLSHWVISDPGIPALLRRMGQIDPDYRPAARFEKPIAELVERAHREGTLRTDVDGVDLTVIIGMIGSLAQFGGAYLPFWRRQLGIVLDGLRAEPGRMTELPGPGQDMDGYHAMVHQPE